MLNVIKNNQGILVLEIDSKKCIPGFLEQDSIYAALNEAKNSFFTDVAINEAANSLTDEIIKAKLKGINNSLIIQCGSLSGIKVYVKEVNKEPIVLDLNVPPVEQFDKDALDTKMSNKEDFGLPLIVEALKLRLIGKFNDATDHHRSLTKVTFEIITESDKKVDDHNYALTYRAITHDNFLLTRLLSLYYQDFSTLYDKEDLSTYDKNDPGYDPSTLLKYAAEHASINTLAALLKLQLPLPAGNISFRK